MVKVFRMRLLRKWEVDVLCQCYFMGNSFENVFQKRRRKNQKLSRKRKKLKSQRKKRKRTSNQEMKVLITDFSSMVHKVFYLEKCI